jgi:hypothetical protein
MSATNTASNIMNIIDEVKETMEDNTYIKLCDELKRLNFEEEKISKFYTVKFAYAVPTYNEEIANFCLDVRFGSEILQLTSKEFYIYTKSVEAPHLNNIHNLHSIYTKIGRHSEIFDINHPDLDCFISTFQSQASIISITRIN